MIDLVQLASSGHWVGARLTDAHNTADNVNLGFQGANTNANGFVRQERKALEDGKVYDVLTTHPKWVNQGTIKGWLPWRTLPPKAVFSAKIGFIQGAVHTDGCRFQVWAHYQVSGRETWTRVADMQKGYSGSLMEIKADLSWLSGKSVSIELRVDAGASSGQDWAVWVAPKIDSRAKGPDATLRSFALSRITVTKDDPAEPGGDEPYLAAIYFRTVLGYGGSTKVVLMDKLQTLGDGMDSGDSKNIPTSAGLSVVDFATVWPLSDVLAADGVALCGLVVVGVEEDSGGKGTVRSKVKTKANILLKALRKHIEPLTMSAVIADASKLGDAIKAVEADLNPPGGVILSGGGFDLVGAIESWLGDDLVDTNQLMLVAVDQPTFDLLGTLAGPQGVTLDCGAENNPTCALVPKTVDLKLSGNGSRWTVRVTIANSALVGMPSGI